MNLDELRSYRTSEYERTKNMKPEDILEDTCRKAAEVKKELETLKESKLLKN